jgi:hypothetical protein
MDRGVVGRKVDDVPLCAVKTKYLRLDNLQNTGICFLTVLEAGSPVSKS